MMPMKLPGTTIAMEFLSTAFHGLQTMTISCTFRPLSVYSHQVDKCHVLSCRSQADI